MNRRSQIKEKRIKKRTKRSVECFFFCLLAGVCALSLTRCTTVAVVGGGTVVGATVFREKSAFESVSDTVLSTKVAKALYKISPEVHATVGVNVQEHEVLLTGVVATDDLRKKVEESVWKVKGVKQVYNDVEVSDRIPIKNYARDAWITSRVKAKLLANPKIRSLNYSVKTVNNVVYIFGIARTAQELDLVCDIARHVTGAVRVRSYVRLKDGVE